MRIDGATTEHLVSANTTQLNQLTGFCHYSNLTYFVLVLPHPQLNCQTSKDHKKHRTTLKVKKKNI